MAISKLKGQSSARDNAYFPQPQVSVTTTSATDVVGLDVTGKGRLDYLTGNNSNTSYMTTITIIIDGTTFGTYQTAPGTTNVHILYEAGYRFQQSLSITSFEGLNIKFNKSLKILYRTNFSAGTAGITTRYSLAG